MSERAPDLESRNTPSRDKQAAGWGFALVALAAALWGADGVFRRGLALELPAATVVFWEHLILVMLTGGILLANRESLRRLTRRDWVSLTLIGVGASATATALFTAAFRLGDPTTPLLLQKLQPLFAIGGAWLILGERLRGRFGVYCAAAVMSAWLITFPDPFAVNPQSAKAAGLAVGAAALWGLGTVLGRDLSDRIAPLRITALRFAIGLPAATVIVLLTEGYGGFAISGGDVGPLLLLALIPGLIALAIYYRGLETTPASLATLAELAFPLSAVSLNYLVFGTTLRPTQWAGVLGLSIVLVSMSKKARDRGSRGLGVIDLEVRPAPMG
jgi:DME family drug/metabolite transporter